MDYDEHLDRALDQAPDVGGTTSRFSVPDSELRQEGNATVFENFQAILEVLDRDANHLMKYLQDDLGTSASIDDRGRLRLTGEFRPSRVGDAIDEYVDAFVRCTECGLPDTHLEERNGVEVLRCEACGAQSATGA